MGYLATSGFNLLLSIGAIIGSPTARSICTPTTFTSEEMLSESLQSAVVPINSYAWHLPFVARLSAGAHELQALLLASSWPQACIPSIGLELGYLRESSHGEHVDEDDRTFVRTSLAHQATRRETRIVFLSTLRGLQDALRAVGYATARHCPLDHKSNLPACAVPLPHPTTDMATGLVQDSRSCISVLYETAMCSESHSSWADRDVRRNSSGDKCCGW